MKTALGECPYVGIPAFVSKAFRHTSIYVRTDRIKEPKDLKGKKVGVPEYQLTANVWARAILEDDFGVKPSDIHWIRGGIEHAGRPEKSPSSCRRGCGSTTRRRAQRFPHCSIPARSTASSRRVPPTFSNAAIRNVGWLFRRSGGGGEGLLQAHRHFPDHASDRHSPHLAEKHPWLPAAVFKAFEQSKTTALAKLSDTSPPR